MSDENEIVQEPLLKLCVVEGEEGRRRIMARFHYPSDAMEFMKRFDGGIQLYYEIETGKLIHWDDNGPELRIRP